MAVSGGQPQLVTTVADGEQSHDTPSVLPGGQALLFSAKVSGSATNEIWVLSLGTGERKRLIEGSSPQYVETGHIIFQKDGLLLGAPFDLNELEVSGPSSPVSEPVRTYFGPEWAQYSISSTGTLAYIPEHGTVSTLLWADRQGEIEQITQIRQNIQSLKLSPDGRYVAASIWDRMVDRDIWIYDITRPMLQRSTVVGTNHFPVWSNDGKKILFGSDRIAGFNIFWKLAEGTGEAEQLTEGGRYHIPSSISPEGVVAYTEGVDPNVDIWIIPLEGDGEPQEFLATEFDEKDPAFSPDGRWLAFTSNQSGLPEVYVVSYPSKEKIVQISSQGGAFPMWRRDGKELFFRTAEKVKAVSFSTNPELSVGSSEILIEGDYAIGRTYDVSPDGQRFLMLQIEDLDANQITVVLNWF